MASSPELIFSSGSSDSVSNSESIITLRFTGIMLAISKHRKPSQCRDKDENDLARWFCKMKETKKGRGIKGKQTVLYKCVEQMLVALLG